MEDKDHKEPPTPYAFIGRFPIYRGRIVSDVVLCNPQEGCSDAVTIRALWDTGCSMSIVSRRVAEFLRLPQSGEKTMRTPFGAKERCKIALTRICVLLGGTRLDIQVAVNEKPCSDLDCDMILGLDFITKGDFAITHDGGQLCLSFCYPPIGYPTDFSIIAPQMMNCHVATSDFVIDESEAHESHRRSLVMLDYFKSMGKYHNP